MSVHNKVYVNDLHPVRITASDGSTPEAGYVLSSLDANGTTTWSSPSSLVLYKDSTATGHVTGTTGTRISVDENGVETAEPAVLNNPLVGTLTHFTAALTADASVYLPHTSTLKPGDTYVVYLDQAPGAGFKLTIGANPTTPAIGTGTALGADQLEGSLMASAGGLITDVITSGDAGSIDLIAGNSHITFRVATQGSATTLGNWMIA